MVPPTDKIPGLSLKVLVLMLRAVKHPELIMDKARPLPAVGDKDPLTPLSRGNEGRASPPDCTTCLFSCLVRLPCEVGRSGQGEWLPEPQ